MPTISKGETMAELQAENNGHIQRDGYWFEEAFQRDGYWFEAVFGVLTEDGEFTVEHLKRQMDQRIREEADGRTN